MPNPLEAWIKASVHYEAARDLGLRSFIEKKRKEGGLSDVEAYKLFKLRRLIEYLHEASPFYSKLFKERGLSPGAVKDFDDLAKVPFTTDEDLISKPYSFLCVSLSEILRGFTVEVADGRWKRIFFTKDELLRSVSAISIGLKMVGMDMGDVVCIAFPEEAEWGLPHILKMAVEEGGGNPVTTQVDLFERLARGLLDTKPALLIGPSSYLFFFTEWCREEATVEIGQLKLKALILARGCSFAPLTSRMRSEIERVWRCRVHDCYSITEMGFAVALECPARKGLHVNELDVLAEVVDPESGEGVGEGEEGVLVLTSLGRRGMPILRYWTGDVTAIVGRTCECGSTDNMKIKSVKRRVSKPPPAV